ncbi:uncharacterized protein LOC133302090 [Gastrolobium bilobum]|uniref:uncharacterized protein LOC133302090 n=1 Tax=Gastrolobium bilobum TaxID=150636 RepID=UPI002AAF8852|nr:uncharacterized protein LOC133302090 [Gastrolobium bilobum]
MVGPNGGSGFGWNDAKKMIDVERVIFDDWAKTHPSAKGLFNKPFPHYDALGSIFGKDVATGGSAVGAQDAVNDLERETTCYDDSGTPFEEYLDLTGDYIPSPLDEPPVPDIPTEEAVPQSPVSIVTGKKGKKRTRTEDPLVDVMKDLSDTYRKSTNSIDKLVSCFQHQADGSSSRMSIMDELKKFDELTDPQMVHIALQLSRDSTMTDVFMQCNDGQRKCLLAGLLANFQ